MVKNILLKIGLLRAGVRLGGFFARIANQRYKTTALLAASLLVLEFVYLALTWPKAPVWTIQGLPESFQWGSLKFQQVAVDRLPMSIRSTSEVDLAYSQRLLAEDGKYFIILVRRPEGWNENHLEDKFRDYLAKTYPSHKQLILPDKTSVTESVFIPENVTMKVLPSFNLRLLVKESHQIAFLVDRHALILSNHPQALLQVLMNVDK